MRSVKANRGKDDRGFQCRYCIDVITTEARMARHVQAKHPEKVEEWIRGGE